MKNFQEYLEEVKKGERCQHEKLRKQDSSAYNPKSGNVDLKKVAECVDCGSTFTQEEFDKLKK